MPAEPISTASHETNGIDTSRPQARAFHQTTVPLINGGFPPSHSLTSTYISPRKLTNQYAHPSHTPCKSRHSRSPRTNVASRPTSSSSNPHGPPPLPPNTWTSRLGGPFLYDLLPPPFSNSKECSTVPIESAWYAAHQEEEIFEMGALTDEDKVICALWNRWMLANRYEASFILSIL